jgi:DNA-binding NarL/FixJ family response regulator
MRLIVCDSSRLVREALRHAVTHYAPNAEVVELEEIQNLTEYLSANNEIDLLLVDIFSIGVGRTDDVVKFVKAQHPIKIVVMSIRSTEVYVRKLIDAGCFGYIPKDISLNSLVAAINLIISGEKFFPPELSNSVEGVIKELSERELRILWLLVRGYTNKQIANELNIDEVGVKGQVRSLGVKLGGRTRTEIAFRAMPLLDRLDFGGKP